MLAAAEEVIEEEGWCAAACRCLGSSVEEDTSSAGIVLLCQDDLVAKVVAAVLLTACTGRSGVLVIDPGAEGGLRGTCIKEAGGVQVEVLCIPIQVEGLADLSCPVGNAVCAGRKDTLGRRCVVQVAIEGIMEDELGLCLWDVLGDVQPDALSPCIPEALHLAHLIGILRSDVVCL